MFGDNGNRSIIWNSVVWILIISLLLLSKSIVCSNDHALGISKSEVANKTDNLQFQLLGLGPQRQVEDKSVIRGDGFVKIQIVDNRNEKGLAGSKLSNINTATNLSESVSERASMKPSRPIRRNKRNAQKKRRKRRRKKRGKRRRKKRRSRKRSKKIRDVRIESKTITENGGNKRQYVTVKKVFPVKVKIETLIPVKGDKVKKNTELKKVKEIKKEVKNLLEHGDPCLTSPCRNKAVCEKVGDKKYKCICPKGYQGRHCESKSNTIVYSAEENLSNDDSNPDLVLIISLSVCIPLGLIFLFISIHFIRVQIRRSQLVGQYEQEIAMGLLPENLPPDYGTISNTLCEEVFCACQKPKYTVDDIVTELERVATTEQLNNLVQRVSSRQ